jgi:hypothetical protein
VKATVGCWADSPEEAKKYVSEDLFDLLSMDTDAELAMVTDCEPTGERPFTK